MIRLLLVEDDASLSYIIRCGLEELIGGYQVAVAANGAEGLEAWRTMKPDIIVADIEMPVMDGYEMVRRIRETDGDVPILFTSGRVSPKDVVKGYELGVNNYVKKPFMAEELDAHVRALLKLKQGSPSVNEEDTYRMGRILVFDARQSLLKQEGGEVHTLTQRESELLQLLCKNKGRVVKREAILAELWKTDDDYFASRSLDVFVLRLRKLLAVDPSVELKTVKGVGLMLQMEE